MKRLLYVSLVAGLVATQMQAMETVKTPMYSATFVNPTTLKGKEGSRFQLPHFVNAAKIGKTQTTKVHGRPVKKTTFDLSKAIQNPGKNTTISISSQNNKTVYTICIDKSILPEASKTWGIEGTSGVEQGNTWCFTLKEGQGLEPMMSIMPINKN